MCRTVRSIALPTEKDEWCCRDPQAGCACMPHACGSSPGIVSTPYVTFSYVLLDDFTQKSFTHNQKHRSKKVTHTPESQFTSTKACSAVTRLNSCSTEALTSLIFLNEEELPCKPAQQQGLSGQADTVCTWCWEALWEPNTRACDPLGPWLSPTTCQTP